MSVARFEEIASSVVSVERAEFLSAKSNNYKPIEPATFSRGRSGAAGAVEFVKFSVRSTITAAATVFFQMFFLR